ncbi:MAG TPA: AAA family ATPase, partial [Arenimonas sp.]|nr:AAA family ATPase [Arenimonas sp.]
MSRFAPWQQAVLDTALGALAERRLGHALLLVGPEHMGKAEFADALAQRLLCATPGDDGLACGRCRGCQLYAHGTHPDFRRETLQVNEKTGKQRSEIVIDQVRGLGAWFALTPQLGGAQVALIDPADSMNTATSNALLKTLEEPAPNRFLLLVSSRPGRLPATIRSRCQRLLFRLPPRAEALAWLHSRGHEAARA